MTTDTNILENSENCIVYTDDQLIRGLRESLSTYIGRKITSGLLGAIGTSAHKYLSRFVLSEQISNFTGLRVVQDTVKATRVLVSFKYLPTYPCNEIEVKYGFDLV